MISNFNSKHKIELQLPFCVKIIGHHPLVMCFFFFLLGKKALIDIFLLRDNKEY